ncbi:hypothetical protein TNCV_132661 [Trichonephila clavipes]|nr:hypothetical protein TNCV_132661 [Trichonephila clavipes]
MRRTSHNHLDSCLRWRTVGRLEVGQLQADVAPWKTSNCGAENISRGHKNGIMQEVMSRDAKAQISFRWCGVE